MADRIDHGHDGQTERQSDAEEADPEVGKARRDHRAAAAAENQPEGADELGQSLLHIAHMTLSSRRRSWAPPARSDVISRSAYDNPSSHTASGGCDGLDEMARPLLEREGGVGQPRRHPAERSGALADRRRARPDERRVGKGCVSQGIYRWSPDSSK